MTKRTVAAELVAYVTAKGPGGPRNPLVVSQLRALLGVARAADRLIFRRPGWFVVRDGIQYAKPLRLALDRLSRLSTPKRARKR